MLASPAMGKPAAVTVTEEQRRQVMADLARIRWAGTSKAKRRRIALKMVAARRRKRRQQNNGGR